MGADRQPERVPLLSLSAVELRDRMASGALSAVALAEACLAQIAAREPDVQAWAWLESEHMLEQARTLDQHRKTGRPIGPLHGLPVGLKDIIDTRRIPTENGTVVDAGRVPSADAAVVERLRAAGAVIAGKTVTTELAFLEPSKTRNPVDAGRTPGGSSSGSAAAVASAMVPLAIGTQTGGSVIRPAAYCGTVGYKPTFGAIPRTGILSQSPSLDTVGVFARSVEDAALMADCLFGHDPADRATQAMPPPRLLRTAQAKAPVRPTFAFLRLPGWDMADAETVDAMRELADALGDYCFEAFLPKAFEQAAEIRERINFAEMAKCYYRYDSRSRDQLSDVLRGALDAGAATSARDYIAALDWPGILNAALSEIFQRCDAILTPATPTPAGGRETTGSAIFNGVWTLCGTPVVTLPLLQSQDGLPMGVQLVGPLGEDARLLRTARWLVNHIEGTEE